MGTAHEQIEQQMTVLLRRVQKIHLSTSSGDMALERSAYGIMCKLADEGPQRLGSLATGFGLDPSTITRQVQALEEAGLAERQTDPSDRRASILDLTGNGRDVLAETREVRREAYRAVLEDWSAEDAQQFARLLEKWNITVDALIARNNAHPSAPAGAESLPAESR